MCEDRTNTRHNPGIEEVKNILEDSWPDGSTWLWNQANHSIMCRKVLDVADVRIRLSELPSTLGVSPVLPPNLHLLPGQRGEHGHCLHLLHCQEG